MKRIKKLASLLLAMVMALAMSVTVFAAGETGSITISNTTKDAKYNVYRIFNLDSYVLPDEKVEGNLILEERVISLHAEIQEKEAQLFEVQDEITKVKDSNETLEIEKEKLNEEIEKLKRAQSESKRDFKEIVTTYEQMSAKSAAPVITKMGDAEAVQILSNLKPATLAAILEKMAPEEAAKYTSMLTK